MTCPYCDRAIWDGSIQCPFCGAPVRPSGSRARGCSHAPGHPDFTPLPKAAPHRTKRFVLPLVLALVFLLVVIPCCAALLSVLHTEARTEPVTPAFSALSESETVSTPSRTEPPQPDEHEDLLPEASAAAYLRAEEIFPDFSSCYYLSRLSDADLNVACLLYEAAMRFDTQCALPEHVSESSFTNVFFLLEFDCPELLQLDFASSVSYTTDRLTGDVSSVTLPYRMSQSEYQSASEACLSVIDSLKAYADGMTALEREFLVYDYLTGSCVYDADSAYVETAYGALVNGRAKCDGVTYAVTWALRELGVPCISVGAYPADGSIGHAWNLVRLEGTYYALDVTANLFEEGDEPFSLYLYCNVPDSALLCTYPVLDDCIVWAGGLPEAESMDMNYYVLTGRYVSSGADYSDLLDALFTEAYDTAGYFTLQFEDADELRDLCAHISDELDTWQAANGIDVVIYSCAPLYEEGCNILYMSLEPETESQAA